VKSIAHVRIEPPVLWPTSSEFGKDERSEQRDDAATGPDCQYECRGVYALCYYRRIAKNSRSDNPAHDDEAGVEDTKPADEFSHESIARGVLGNASPHSINITNEIANDGRLKRRSGGTRMRRSEKQMAVWIA
jgi:hypothetical protein